MKSTFCCHVVSLIVSCTIATCFPRAVLAEPEAPIHVACLGDSITPGALEMSNVNLAQEFTEMITAQRGFQANARIISTGDEMLNELVNIKR